MSALLLDEPLLCYQPALVRRIGLAEAAIVQQLHFWLRLSTNIHEGERYVYKTYDEWSAEIGISARAVRGACDRLRKAGVLVAIQSPLEPHDRTLWWRIDHDTIEPGGGSKCPSGQIRDDATGSSRAGDRGRTETTAEMRKKEDARAKPPPDFPDELRPHAREVMRILQAVAEQHGCRKVWPLAVGRVIMANPRKPLVAQAHRLAVWAVDPPRAVKDVVATYGRFLADERELAAVESLAEDGTPAAPMSQQGANVTPIRGGRYDARAAKADREASREAAARRLLAQQQPSA